MVYVLLGTLLAMNVAFVGYKTAKVVLCAASFVKENSESWKETTVKKVLYTACLVDALKTFLARLQNRFLVVIGVYDAVEAVYAIDRTGTRVAELTNLEGLVSKLCKIVLNEHGFSDSFAIEITGLDENGANLNKIILPDEIVLFPIVHNIQIFEASQCIIATIVCKETEEHMDVTNLCMPWTRLSKIENALVGIYRSLLDEPDVMLFLEGRKECELALFLDDFSLSTYPVKSSDEKNDEGTEEDSKHDLVFN